MAAQVPAMIAGRRPAKGIFSSRDLRASVPVDQVADLHPFIGLGPTGEWFLDLLGGQEPEGH